MVPIGGGGGGGRWNDFVSGDQYGRDIIFGDIDELKAFSDALGFELDSGHESMTGMSSHELVLFFRVEGGPALVLGGCVPALAGSKKGAGGGGKVGTLWLILPSNFDSKCPSLSVNAMISSSKALVSDCFASTGFPDVVV